MPTKQQEDVKEPLLSSPEKENSIKEQVPDTEKEEMKQRLALLERMILENKQAPAVPQTVVHDVKATLQKPKRILFTINAIQDEDAQHEGVWIPGKAIVSLFKFKDELKCDVYGTRYTTGFEPEELETSSGLQGDELQNYLKEVKIARQWIERYYPANLSNDNADFWRNRTIVIEALDRIYDTKEDLDNLITYYNILGGGFPSIGKNYDDAKKFGKRLYVSVQEEEEERKFNHRGTFIEANATLQDILTNWSVKDAIYLLYYLPLKKQVGYHFGTPMQQIINQFADYIDASDTKMSGEKKKRPQMFLDAVKVSKENKDLLRATAFFKGGVYYGYITYSSSDKTYQNRATGFNYGNSEKGAIEALLNPKHIDEISWLKSKVNDKWLN